MKYALISGVVRWTHGTTVLSKGDAADEDHPLVVERPDLFGDEAPPPKLTGPARAAAVVERATRAPGEVRDTPRRGPGRPRKVAPPVESAADE